MNLTAAIMLVNKEVRPVRVEYDPDYSYKNNPNKLFKTLDPNVKKDDYVIVPTSTRHGFTVCKVTEVDFTVNFDSPTDYAWVVGVVDKTAYDAIIEQEAVVVQRVSKGLENKQRKELADAMGLADVTFTDLDIVQGTVALPQPSSPRGAGNGPANEAAQTHADASLAPLGGIAPVGTGGAKAHTRTTRYTDDDPPF